MRTRTRVLLAAAGLSAVLAAGVPAVALADGGSSAPSATCAHPRADYLKAHPDVQAELKKIRALPADQRKAERQSYLSAHPDVKAALEKARQDAKGSLATRLGALGDELAKHPEVADLLQQLRTAPAGQRADVAKQFLAQHPDLRGQLHQLRKELRDQRAACRTGGN